VHSEILNDYFSVVVTDRTIRLVHEHHGFDHYILKTPACDLRSLLAIRFKRKMLKSLFRGCPMWEDDPVRQEEIKKEYEKYLQQYTPEEIDWYGLTFDEAIRKQLLINKKANPIVPHKIVFRKKLIEQLREAGIKEASEIIENEK
jgi:large subunit ribosomal protein L28